MPSQAIASSTSYWEKIKRRIETAFSEIADLRIKEGLTSIAKAGGEGIAAAVLLASLNSM